MNVKFLLEGIAAGGTSPTEVMLFVHLPFTPVVNCKVKLTPRGRWYKVGEILWDRYVPHLIVVRLVEFGKLASLQELLDEGWHEMDDDPV